MDKPKILICDNEEAVLESLHNILARDYETILTNSSEGALEKLKETKDIKVVLLDIKLGGIETLKQIKNMRADLPVIMVTDYQATETTAEAIKLGALDYIIKPINAASVLGSIRKAL
ncbi:MAG: response regulator [Candidatus Omnitrophota bacterium]|nr:MAG: response regulator [Candidatus Omnitrophota bacterium]